ncbi:hypothetical protein [Candidatus Hodarchaeum mangrovi]
MHIEKHLSEGVFTVIEIKSNLTKSKFQKAFQTFNMVKNFNTATEGMTIRSGASFDSLLRCVYSIDGA